MIRRIRDLNQTLKYPVAIMLDTQGPEIRTGFNEVNLEVGDELCITVPPQKRLPIQKSRRCTSTIST